MGIGKKNSTEAEVKQDDFFQKLGVPPVEKDKIEPKKKPEPWSQHDRHIAHINRPIVRTIKDGEPIVIGMNDT